MCDSDNTQSNQPWCAASVEQTLLRWARTGCRGKLRTKLRRHHFSYIPPWGLLSMLVGVVVEDDLLPIELEYFVLDVDKT
jgi:hypothetical protein